MLKQRIKTPIPPPEAWKYQILVAATAATNKNKKTILRSGKSFQISPEFDYVYHSYRIAKSYEFPVYWYNLGQLLESQFRGKTLPTPLYIATEAELNALNAKFDADDALQS